MNTASVVLGGSARLLLALRHGLEVLEEQPQRDAAREGFVGCDVAYLLAADAGDDDFGGSFLVLPVAVDGDADGWSYALARVYRFNALGGYDLALPAT